MAQFKVIKQANEVYYTSTIEGEVEVNGVPLRYRYSEDNNGASLYILNDGEWESCDENIEEHLELFNACLMISPEEFGCAGETFDLDDDFL